MPVANRGEVWLVDLGYVAKVRPCLVLSFPPSGTDRAITTIIPHTTSPRGTSFEVALSVRFLQEGVFDAQNPATISQSKFIRRLGTLTADQLKSIEDVVRSWLGLC